MRTKGRSFGRIALVVAVPCFGAACGGGSETGSTGASVSAQGVERVEGTGSPFTRHLPRAALRLQRSTPAGNGSVQFVACTGGASCTGSLAMTQVAAQFFPDATPVDAGASDAGPTCTSVAEGECEETTCTIGGTSSGPSGVNAGTLTIGGGAIGTQELVARARSGWAYAFGAPGALFTAGDTLTVEGSGGAVPAFTTQSVVAPGLLTLVRPAAPKGSYDIATASHLHVEWSGGTPGDAMFIEGDAATSTIAASFTCLWDAAEGHAEVPAAVLAPMAGLSGDLLWGEQAANAFDASRYAIALEAITYGDSPATYE